jgi:hypothetical protein
MACTAAPPSLAIELAGWGKAFADRGNPGRFALAAALLVLGADRYYSRLLLNPANLTT